MEGLIWINENLHSSEIVNEIVKIITSLGNGAIFWIAFALFLLIFRKTRDCGIVMLISLAIGYIFNDFILKNIIHRDRPFVANVEFSNFLKSINMKPPSGFSFPSGHAYSSFNCAVVILLFNRKLGWISIPVATLIALSRVFLCVHYPTDVLTGVILGIVTALIIYYCYKVVKRKIFNLKRRKIFKRIYND